jgi:hypothetical protein
MGSPISNTITEVFLQTIENTHIKQLLDTTNILYYTKYVDDIFVIYDTRHIDNYTVHKYISQIHPNIQLNPTYEHNNQINFLDLLIILKQSKLEIDICRKPTTTNTTINYTSNHPTEHKIAGYRHYIRRMLSLPLTTEIRKKEWKTIQNIATSNNFLHNTKTKLKTQVQQQIRAPQNTETHTQKTKPNRWAVFTYHSPKIRKLTNLFKQTDIEVAFRSTNTILQHTTPTLKKPKNTNMKKVEFTNSPAIPTNYPTSDRLVEI